MTDYGTLEALEGWPLDRVTDALAAGRAPDPSDTGKEGA